MEVKAQNKATRFMAHGMCIIDLFAFASPSNIVADCVTLVLLVRGVELTVVLPLRKAHGEGGEVKHNHQLEKSCFAAQILTSSVQVITRTTALR